MGINLHAIVRSTITAIHDDETVLLYRSNSNTVDSRGIATATFKTPVSVKANVQIVDKTGFTDVLDALKNRNGIPETVIAYNFYLYSEEGLNNEIMGINRIAARGGDMIKRADNTWYLVTSIKDDYSQEGWQCVVGTQQITGVTSSQITGS